MHKSNSLSITNIPAISAIYFALLQCDYRFYEIHRDAALTKTLRTFILDHPKGFDFFTAVKQTTCEAYPYWPRAAMLESASFYLSPDLRQFSRFDEFKDFIMSAKNLSAPERDASFWTWVVDFPTALVQVMEHGAFRRYLEWEDTWLSAQTAAHHGELQQLQTLIDVCQTTYQTAIKTVQIVVNPIKCLFSADYHQIGSLFIVSAGAFHPDTVIHEFLHPIVHPVIERHRDDLFAHPPATIGLDVSYSLGGNADGIINASEEYMVRKLTDAILRGHPPKNLDKFLRTLQD